MVNCQTDIWSLSLVGGNFLFQDSLWLIQYPAVTTTRDESNGDCFLHLGTIGGLGAVASFDQLATNDSPGVPRWHRVTEELLDQFDLNRDLGGHAVARIWGLASYRRMTAVLFTRHPTDMVEYQLASSDGTTVGFVTEQPSDAQSPEQHDSADKPARVDHAQWKAAIAFLLSGSGACYENDAVNQQLVYTAACCALMGGQDETIRTQARQSFERLAAITGADLSEEMANCNVEAPIVSPKTTEQLSGPGAHLFERCEICEAGITWFSATEAQCANGHLFGTPSIFIRRTHVLTLRISTMRTKLSGYSRTWTIQVLLHLPDRVPGRGSHCCHAGQTAESIVHEAFRGI